LDLTTTTMKNKKGSRRNRNVSHLPFLHFGLANSFLHHFVSLYLLLVFVCQTLPHALHCLILFHNYIDAEISSSAHYSSHTLCRVPHALGKGTHALGKSFAECNTRQRGSVEPFHGKGCFAECQILPSVKLALGKGLTSVGRSLTPS